MKAGPWLACKCKVVLHIILECKTIPPSKYDWDRSWILIVDALASAGVAVRSPLRISKVYGGMLSPAHPAWPLPSIQNLYEKASSTTYCFYGCCQVLQKQAARWVTSSLKELGLKIRSTLLFSVEKCIFCTTREDQFWLNCVHYQDHLVYHCTL